MDDLGGRIREVLDDPQQMAQIMDMAQSLLGGEAGADAPQAPAEHPLPEKLIAMLGQSGGGREQQALLAAMRPYLSEKRQKKMERAMQLTRMAHMAKLAMESLGGGEDA